MPCQPANSIDRIRVVHEDEPANDGIKRTIKLYCRRIAFEKFDIFNASRLSTGRSPLHGCSGAVNANDLTAWPDQVGGQKCDVSTATTNIENAHARSDPGLLK
jgi:hypothetical protein